MMALKFATELQNCQKLVIWASKFWGADTKTSLRRFYCRWIHIMCSSFIKFHSEVSVESIEKKQHLQNRYRRHIHV